VTAEARYPYPLAWPTGWRRTPAQQRRRASFSRRVRGDVQTWRLVELTIADGRNRLLDELRKLGATAVIISSGLRLRQDWLPMSAQREPEDPGVAVYFTLKGKPRCFACDTWTRIADNLASIAGVIEALRTIDRYGVGNVEQAFAGYTAFLPAAAEEWPIVFGVAAHTPTDTVLMRYRALAKQHHPDAGGDAAAMTRINLAYEAFKRERGIA